MFSYCYYTVFRFGMGGVDYSCPKLGTRGYARPKAMHSIQSVRVFLIASFIVFKYHKVSKMHLQVTMFVDTVPGSICSFPVG